VSRGEQITGLDDYDSVSVTQLYTVTKPKRVIVGKLVEQEQTNFEFTELALKYAASGLVIRVASDVIYHLLAPYRRADKLVQVTVDAPVLDHCIASGFSIGTQFDLASILTPLSNVVQSVRALDLADGMELTVVSRDLLTFAGGMDEFLTQRRLIYSPTTVQTQLRRKHGIIVNCMIAAAALALVRRRRGADGALVKLVQHLQQLCNHYDECADERLFPILANALLEHYQRHLVVLTAASRLPFKVYYSSKSGDAQPHYLYLLYYKQHFYYVGSVRKMLAKAAFCRCGSIRTDAGCTSKNCVATRRLCPYCASRKCKQRTLGADSVHCVKCNIFFVDRACYTLHRCGQLFRCVECDRIVSADDHGCGTVFCKVCLVRQPVEHVCYIKTRQRRHVYAYRCYIDIETVVIEHGRLQPIVCCLMWTCAKCESDFHTPKLDCCGSRFATFTGVGCLAGAVKQIFNVKNTLLIAHGMS
jgi:hypothetical protein